MGCVAVLKPQTFMFPAVCGMKQVIIFMVVVLPAPFGPRKPTISPLLALKDMLLTASWLPYCLVSWFISITGYMVFCTNIGRVCGMGGGGGYKKMCVGLRKG